jgi:hypothetical protein
MIRYVENFSYLRLIKHVARDVSIYMAKRNFHINEHHFTREKFNQLFSEKDSGLVYMKLYFFYSGLY